MNNSSMLAVLLVVKPEGDVCCLQQLRHRRHVGNNKTRSSLKLHILHPKVNGKGVHFLCCHCVFIDSKEKDECNED
jgi:hypothetical protein